MKKLIYTILAASIIFVSCRKDEETNPGTGNNDITVTDNDTIVGVWSPKSGDMEMSYKVIQGAEITQEMDTSYTIFPGDDEFDNFPINMKFTADGKAIYDGDIFSYTYFGNVLKITEVLEDGTEEVTAFECVVTATSLKMTLEESEEDFEGDMSYSTSFKVTLNSERGLQWFF